MSVYYLNASADRADATAAVELNESQLRLLIGVCADVAQHLPERFADYRELMALTQRFRVCVDRLAELNTPRGDAA